MSKVLKTFFIIAMMAILSLVVNGEKVKRDFYQIKIYHLKNNDQVGQVDKYLKNVYLPTLHRLGIKNIGVFKPIANDTSLVKFIYVIIPFNSPEAWMKLEGSLAKDAAYTSLSKNFRESPSDNPPFVRIESILLEAFSGHGHMLLPVIKNTDKVFELRSYEAQQKIFLKKKWPCLIQAER